MQQIIIIILSVLLILFIISLLKSLLYFHPSKELLEIIPKFIPFNIQHLSGLKLSNNYRRIIIYFTDNKNNITFIQNKLLLLHNILQCDILTFNYSTFGNSKGILLSEQQLQDDVSLITAMVLKQYKCNNIILYGHQIGAPLALYVARRYNIPFVILESPLPSIKYIFNKKFHKLLHIFFKEFNTSLYLDGYKGNSLILYNENDTLNNLLFLCSQSVLIPNNDTLPFNEIKMFIGSN
jgi:hypothetical protein